ncbi:hypothetical protein D3C76_1730490 [compost metagenome]
MPSITCFCPMMKMISNGRMADTAPAIMREYSSPFRVAKERMPSWMVKRLLVFRKISGPW